MCINFRYNTDMDTTKVQVIYQELQGILSQLDPIGTRYAINENECLPQFKSVLVRLTQVTGEGYDQYIPRIVNDDSVSLGEYRRMLAALIERLHAEFSLVSPQTSVHSPSTSFNINQNQSQSQYQTTVLDIQEKIINSLSTPDLKPEEKGFLEKLKTQLRNTSDVASLFKTIFSTAAAFGLTIPVVAKLLGLSN